MGKKKPDIGKVITEGKKTISGGVERIEKKSEELTAQGKTEFTIEDATRGSGAVAALKAKKGKDAYQRENYGSVKLKKHLYTALKAKAKDMGTRVGVLCNAIIEDWLNDQ